MRKAESLPGVSSPGEDTLSHCSSWWSGLMLTFAPGGIISAGFLFSWDGWGTMMTSPQCGPAWRRAVETWWDHHSSGTLEILRSFSVTPHTYPEVWTSNIIHLIFPFTGTCESKIISNDAEVSKISKPGAAETLMSTAPPRRAGIRSSQSSPQEAELRSPLQTLGCHSLYKRK